MAKKLRIVLAQLNLLVGDISGNLEKHIQAANKAKEALKADVIVFPELSLTGYPPEDLLLRTSFIQAAESALQQFITRVRDIYCVIGHPRATSRSIYNACSVVYNGLIASYDKQHLPNYGIFDEKRYFLAGHTPCVVNIKGIPTGLIICEDLWVNSPIHKAISHGAHLIIVPNASPFEICKHDRRINILTNRVKENKLPIVYVNQVGGQDELIFDGGSMVMDANGNICQFAGCFKEALLPVDITFMPTGSLVETSPISLPSHHEKIYQALVLGVRDYVNKNKFKGVLIGVSGGIDSALTLAIAVDALGKERVRAVIMPSRYTSDISMKDAMQVTQAFDVATDVVSIDSTYQSFLETLAPLFKDRTPDVTEENIQARVRAVIIMALSNKFGDLVLSTGNRSEVAVGYCTLYGDMAGGLDVLKDVPKTMVYELARYRNKRKAQIPERTVTRAPTAELAPDQKDEDTLPAYTILDKILHCYLNLGQSKSEIVAQGFASDIVDQVVHLIHRNEYKRRQAPPGLRINFKSFGKGWRYPLTSGYND